MGKILSKFLLLILSIFGSSPVSVSIAGNPLIPPGKEYNNKVPENTVTEVSSREYLSFKLYDFDQFENKYILNVSGTFGKLTEKNSYTDTLHYHNPYGGIYYRSPSTLFSE